MQNPSNLEFLLLVILAIICGLGVRFSLGYAKQTWATTYHHTMSYALLPPITMIITTLIAGNLALSLGMIGALSIVRFRNPVKSPLELVIFFALITVGIGVSVNVKLGILMTAVTIFVILGAKIFGRYGPTDPMLSSMTNLMTLTVEPSPINIKQGSCNPFG